MRPASATVPRLRRFTRREYLKLAQLGVFEDEHVELIDGALISKSPAGSFHDATIARLNRLLSAIVGRNGFVRVQMTFDASHASMPEPDLLVVPDGDYGGAYPQTAHLVVEVADSSIEYDRATKSVIYARANLAKYWLVDLRSLAVEVYSKPGRSGYAGLEVARAGDSLTVPGFPRKKVRVADFLPAKRPD